MRHAHFLPLMVMQNLGQVRQSGWEGAVAWGGGLLLLLGLMIFVIVRIRRALSPRDSSPATGFTLGELRDLHRKGKMTDAEFEAAKGLVLKGLKTSVEQPGRKGK
jgi:hypothetical protein